MAPSRTRGGAYRQFISLDGPSTIRQPGFHSCPTSCLSWWINVANAKNDPCGFYNSATTTNSIDNAMDDAPDVRSVHSQLRDGASTVLDNFKSRGYHYPRLCDRLGANIQANQQRGT